MSGAKISHISEGSPAANTNLQIGDEIIKVNGVAPLDIIEYQQLIDGDFVELLLQRSGEPLQKKVSITKAPGQPLGIQIDSAVFDRIRTCDNHCSFCFIYQLPKGLRRSLYVKDDDYRLSFLYGNYTTLTRFTEFDLERVLEENLSPLYVSIHTTNPRLRADMLRNPRGATSLRWLDELLRQGIEIHGQIVVCPNINDGEHLEISLQDILTTYQDMKSVSIVPVGISQFSTETNMRAFEPLEAKTVIDLVAKYQEISLGLLGRRLFHASDEFYLLAGVETPSLKEVDDIDQAENGVAMVAAFCESFETNRNMRRLGSGFFQSVDGIPFTDYRALPRNEFALLNSDRVCILTGEYAAPILSNLFERNGFQHIEVRAVTNTFFGGNIKVAGLLTGSDINRELSQIDDDVNVVIPDVCLNEGRFLDGTLLDELRRPVTVIETSGSALRNLLDSMREVSAS